MSRDSPGNLQAAATFGELSDSCPGEEALLRDPFRISLRVIVLLHKAILWSVRIRDLS